MASSVNIDIFQGDVVPLAWKAEDGVTTYGVRATLYNGGSPVPVGAVDLPHKALGRYRVDFTATLLSPGHYDAVYRVWEDDTFTTMADVEESMDHIRVHPYDRPQIGAVFDSGANVFRCEVTLSKRGGAVRVLSPEVVSATVDVYSADDTVLFSVSDVAPDGEGVFRFSKAGPGFVADRLYAAKVTIVTTTGSIIAMRGFMSTE